MKKNKIKILEIDYIIVEVKNSVEILFFSEHQKRELKLEDIAEEIIQNVMQIDRRGRLLKRV